MRFVLKVIVGLIIFGVFSLNILHIVLMAKGKDIFTREIERLTHKKTTIGFFNIIYPTQIEIRDLVIQDTAKVDSIFIYPSIWGLFTGNIVISNIKIFKPEITIDRTVFNSLTKEDSNVFRPVVFGRVGRRRWPFQLILRNLKVKEGKVKFIDRITGSEEIDINIKDLNFYLNNAYIFPRSIITSFELRGNIPWQDNKEGKIEADGWLNIGKRDMQVTLKIRDIDGVYLHPYYSKWINLDKARIDKATLNFTSNIQGFNNNVTADCRLELADIVRKPLAPEQSEEREAKITDAIIDKFKSLDQGRIVLDFKVNTKMDEPTFGFGNAKVAFEDKMMYGRKSVTSTTMDVVMLPSNLLQGLVRGVADFSKAVIEGTFSIGHELKKSVEDTFKKEEKAPAPVQ